MKRKVIILDEPLSGMDFATQQLVRKCIYNHTEGKILIEITHHDQMLEEFDVVIEMDNGLIQNVRRKRNEIPQKSCSL